MKKAVLKLLCLFILLSIQLSIFNFSIAQNKTTTKQIIKAEISSKSGYSISGIVTYSNSISLLNNVIVNLININSQLVAVDTTGLDGKFIFNNIPNGNYLIDAKSSVDWGGVDPGDALMVNRNYIGSFDISDLLNKYAADVNYDYSIDPGDALLINRRYIGAVNVFKLTDWIFDTTNITVNNSDVIQNIRGICAGDVNGDYLIIIPTKTYNVSFTGTGASNTVDSIKVENITQCIKLNINGKDTLKLMLNMGVKSAGNYQSKSLIIMTYKEGDVLKLTGISGIYRNVFMLVPSQNQTISFDFIACTDTDNNNYCTVHIGTQIWMGENLQTTKYLDGSTIPNLSDSAEWTNTKSGAYCDYHNLTAEGKMYGHLYNWYAVNNQNGLCPAGWHVPTDAEWTTLTTFLGGVNVAGRKMKENCVTRWAYLDTTWGTNISGFTGLCTNFRNSTGSWSKAPDNNHDNMMWSSTAMGTKNAWARSLRWCYGDLWVGPPFLNSGFSVRCLKDNR